VRAGHVPAHGHARHAAFAGTEQRDLRGERIVVAVLARLVVGQQARHGQTGDLGERTARDARIKGVRVGRIVLGRQGHAPVLVRTDVLVHVVVVFALGIDQLAEAAGLEDLAHRVDLRAKRRGLVQRVQHAGLLHRREQLIRQRQLFCAENGRHGRSHVQTALETSNAEPRVAGRVRGDEDRLDLLVLLEHLFARGVGLFGACHLGQLRAGGGVQIGRRDDLDIRVVLEAELRTEFADSVACDADLDLAVGKGRPRGRLDLARIGLVEAGDSWRLGLCKRLGRQRGCCGRLKKCSSG